MDSATRALLHLSLIDGVGPAAIKHIVEACQKSGLALDTLYEMGVSSVRSLGFSDRIAQAVSDGLKDQRLLDRECLLIEKHGVQIAIFGHEGYPAQLVHIPVPPPVLYYRGDLTNQQCLAIVGSRRGTAYARTFIDRIMPDFKALNWHIVSGGAVGVDTMAHQSALAHDVTTTAVLGSGLLNPYPAHNTALFDSIVAAGGAIVSPFALEVLPNKATFPARNRIIAGLSAGVVVVQAAERSGAHITAYHALEQGREVFAVPGPFNDPLSAGCHRLAQQGAKLICNAQDILAEFGQQGPVQLTIAQAPKTSGQRTMLTGLDSLSERVLEACKEPRAIDELAQELAVDQQPLCACLFDLQMRGLAEQNFAGLVQRTASAFRN